MTDTQQSELKAWIEALCMLSVKRYRKIKKLEKQRDKWKSYNCNVGSFNRALSLRNGLKRIENVVQKVDDQTDDNVDIHGKYLLKLIKNNETCMDIAYDYLFKHFEKENIKQIRGIDNDKDRIFSFVIEGTQICWSQPQLQSFKNLVCII